MTLVAGVDSSTQSCKVVVRDLSTGLVVRSGRAAHPTGTEVDPEAWWIALREAVADAGGLADVAAISVGGQQHGLIALNDSGRVIRAALLWNDTRSASAAAELISEVGAARFAERTGSVPVASFTVTKLRWMRDNEPDNAARIAAIALPHDWLTWRLRGFGPENPVLAELTTDRSDASGTGYFDPSTNEYDLDLIGRALGRVVTRAQADDTTTPDASSAREVMNVAVANTAVVNTAVMNAAPDPVGNSGIWLPELLEPGDSRQIVIESPEFPKGLVVGAGAGDNAAAALGLDARPGDVIVSIGTSGTVFGVTDIPARDASGTVAGFADAAGGFLPLIATLNAARILDCVGALLAADADELARLALTAEPGCDGLVLVPYFEGERTPNLPGATASLLGMTLLSTSRTNLARAAIEGMLCGLADGFDAVRSIGMTAERLLLIGGAAQNAAVQAIAAQVFELPVIVPAPAEYVAAGAARQAALALTGVWPHWPITLAAHPISDYRAVIRTQYAARTDGTTTTSGESL